MVSVDVNLLIINNYPPNIQTGTGVTIHNLLHGWPADRRAAVYSAQVLSVEVSDDWRFTHQMSTWQPRGQRYVNAIGPLLVRLGLIDFYDEYVTAKRVVRALRRRRFDPDLILAIPRTILDVEISLALMQALNIPTVWYLHDDWLGMKHYWKVHPGRRRYRPKHVTTAGVYARSFLEQGKCHFAISNEMRDAYRERYGIDFEVFHNPVDIARFNRSSTSLPSADGRQFVFRYVGALWKTMQMPGFKVVCEVFERLHRDGLNVKLEFHSPAAFVRTIDEYRLHSPPAVEYLGEIPHRDVPAFLSGADGLIVNLDFSEQAWEVSSLSMPTKITEYMASGVPILLVGPASAPHIRYAGDGGWGLAVTESSPAALEAAIRTLVEDSGLRKKLGRRSQELARDHHDRDVVSRAFQQRLRDAAGAVGLN